MAKRKSGKPSAYERAYRIIEYLKKHTDAEHTVCPKRIRDDFRAAGMEEYIGTKNTFHDLIVNLSNAMNSDAHEVMKPEEEWRIVFDDFKKEYGFDLLEDDEQDANNKNSAYSFLQIKNLYYNQEFTYSEVNCLIEGIRFSRALDTKASDRLIEKIENHLTSKFYKRNAKRI